MSEPIDLAKYAAEEKQNPWFGLGNLLSGQQENNKQAEPSQVTHITLSLDELLNNPENYNQHPPDQLVELKASLKRFGQIADSVVRKTEQGYMLIRGHGITQAARELIEEDPERYAHLKHWNVVVVPSHWTDLEALAYMVADNKTSEKAEVDTDALTRLLKAQKDAGEDLASMGSDDEELRQLLAEVNREHATDFLDGVLKAPREEEEIGEDGEDGYGTMPLSGADSSSPQYFQVAYSLTAEQRTTVLDALKKAKQRYELQTSNQALVQICTEFLQGK